MFVHSGVAPEDVGYVNAHGTSTHYNDKFETKAIKKVFGSHATKLLISSTKARRHLLLLLLPLLLRVCWVCYWCCRLCRSPCAAVDATSSSLAAGSYSRLCPVRLCAPLSQAMTGHCLGGTAAIETIVAAKVLETGSVPPTLNYRTPDPECDLNYVPNQAVQVKEPMKVRRSSSASVASPSVFLAFVSVFVLTSLLSLFLCLLSSPFLSDLLLQAVVTDTLGFGGHNAALVLTPYKKL